MKRWSLTARMSAMFMLLLTLVLAAASLAFQRLSEHHFMELDQQLLAEKQASARLLLQASEGRVQVLHNLVQAHPTLELRLEEAGQNTVFASPGAEVLAARDIRAGQVWQAAGRAWRGSVSQVGLGVEQRPATLYLALDITHHSAFLRQLQLGFWGAAILSALLGAALAWMGVRNGLRPLREVTRLAQMTSAQSLSQRIDVQGVPAELQQLVQAFNAMLARLDESFERLSAFSADIAHELRTPVSNLMTHTEVILSHPRNQDDYREALYANLEDLQHMARIIDDMLFLAKADNGLIVPGMQPVALQPLASNLLDYYQVLADEQGICLHLQGEAVIAGDRLMLHRALSNLLSNALRYTPAGGTIRVEIRVDEHDAVSVCVDNPGLPIAPEHRERLFERFYRVDPARREGPPGNAGLGLAITRSIVEAHGGHIGCECAAGRTCFRMTFPATLR